MCEPAEGFTVTGIGFIGGMLHVQTSTQGVKQYDNHGYCYLMHEDGTRRLPDFSLSFYDGESQDPERVDYFENVFDISQEELSHYSLYGDFFSSGLLTEGDWRITFPLAQE